MLELKFVCPEVDAVTASASFYNRRATVNACNDSINSAVDLPHWMSSKVLFTTRSNNLNKCTLSGMVVLDCAVFCCHCDADVTGISARCAMYRIWRSHRSEKLIINGFWNRMATLVRVCVSDSEVVLEIELNEPKLDTSNSQADSRSSGDHPWSIGLKNLTPTNADPINLLIEGFAVTIAVTFVTLRRRRGRFPSQFHYSDTHTNNSNSR